MKEFVLLILITLAGCSGGTGRKAAPAETAPLSFNNIAMGTPMDTLVKQVGTEPTQRTDDRLDYTNMTAEGVRWSGITCDFSRGKLARVTATQSGADAASSYRKLYQSFTERYGKPTQDVDSLTIWVRRDAELSLQPGHILFSRR